ncbi:hypothetical protein DFP73DRAFT_502190, partial [Morchella snyderi]
MDRIKRKLGNLKPQRARMVPRVSPGAASSSHPPVADTAMDIDTAHPARTEVYQASGPGQENPTLTPILQQLAIGSSSRCLGGGDPASTNPNRTAIPAQVVIAPSSPVDETTSIFQEAIERYKQKVAIDHKQYLLGGMDVSVAQLIESVGRYNTQHNERSSSRRGLARIQGFLRVVDGYLKSLGVMIQHSPEISSLVVGGLRLFVDIGIRYIGFFDKLSETLVKMERSLSYLSEYATLYGHYEEVKTALCRAYGDMLEFCSIVYDVFAKKDGTLREIISGRILRRQLTTPIEKSFDVIVSSFDDNVGMVERVANIKECRRKMDKEANEVKEKLAAIRLKILMWLSDSKYDDHHRFFSTRRREGTGGWVLAHYKYRHWEQSKDSSIFWLSGNAGSGKTYLASRIVDRFKEKSERDGTHVVAHFYCHYTESGRNDPSSIMRALIKQICVAAGEVPTAVVSIYQEREKRGNSSGLLSVEECRDLFITIAEQFLQVTIIIDALDECDIKKRRSLFRALCHIISEANKVKVLVKILVTGRKSEDIELEFRDHTSYHIDAADNTSDINRYITTEISRRSNLNEMDNEDDPLLEGNADDQLKAHIISVLQSKANGMFIWVQFQIVTICNQSTSSGIRKALHTLPRDLDETYRRIIGNIESQGDDKVSTAKKILRWIFFANSPCKPEAIMQSLTLNPQNPSPEKEYFEWTLPKVLSACQNLVIHDEKLKTLRFAHFSVQEYLQRQPDFESPNGHEEMATLCLTTLMYREEEQRLYFHSGLLDYCDMNWAFHFKKSGCQQGPLIDRCMRLLGHQATSTNSPEYTLWAGRAARVIDDLYLTRDKKIPVHPISAVCYYGLPALLKPLLQTLQPSAINSQNLRGGSPLYLAAQEGHEDVVRILLHNPAVEVNSPGGLPPLAAAASKGHTEIVLALLAVRGIDVNKADEYGGIALLHVAVKGHTEIVLRLLAVRGIDVNKADEYGGIALSHAAAKGHTEIVLALLAVPGIDVNKADELGRTALLHAAAKGH